MEIGYHMKCGCLLSKEQLVLRRGGHRCHKHIDKGVEYVVKTCSVCGKKIKCKPKQSTKKYCDDCQIIQIKVLSKERHTRRRKVGKESGSETKNKMRPELYTRGWEYYLKTAS